MKVDHYKNIISAFRLSTTNYLVARPRAHDWILRLAANCQREGIVAGGVGVKPLRPELAKPATALNAAQRQDVLCAWFAPEHARLLAPRADHCFATGFNHPRPNKEALAAESAILHARDIVNEVA
jgi:hypothetical protein